jgi:RecJ-like exonuclease
MTLSKEGRTVQEYAYDPTNLVKPDVAEPARISDAVVDRISRFGAFADPTSATNRRIEHQQAVDRFQNATDLNAVVEEMNTKLKSSHYHLKITQASPYRPIQIDIVDDMGRPRLGEFIQIQPRRK